MSRRIESLAQLAADVNRRLEDLEAAAGIRPAGIEERMSPLARRLRRDFEELRPESPLARVERWSEELRPAALTEEAAAVVVAQRLRRRVDHLEEQLRTGGEAEEAARRRIAELEELRERLEKKLAAGLKLYEEEIKRRRSGDRDLAAALNRIAALEETAHERRNKIAELEEMLAEKTKGGRPHGKGKKTKT